MTCWLLDLKKAKQFMEPSSMWTKLLLPLPVISKFAAVLEPTGQELLLIGGMQTTDSLQFPRSMSSNVLKIQARIPTLRSLAIDYVAHSTCTFDRSLQSDQLPAHLRNEILVSKEELIGIEAVCTQEEGCVKCQIHRYGCLLPPKKRRRKSMTVQGQY